MATLTKAVEGVDVHLEQVLALTVRGHDVELSQGAAGTITAQGDVRLRESGCGPVVAGRDVEIVEGGCGPVRAGGNVSIEQGGCGPIRAQQVSLHDSAAAVVFADHLEVAGGSKVGVSIPTQGIAGVGIGAAIGAAAGLIAGLLLARQRR